MKINVTQEDLLTPDPIRWAVKREHDLDCSVDNRFLVITKNSTHPFRLPLSAETFMVNFNTGKAVEPFSFEIGS